MLDVILHFICYKIELYEFICLNLIEHYNFYSFNLQNNVNKWTSDLFIKKMCVKMEKCFILGSFFICYLIILLVLCFFSCLCHCFPADCQWLHGYLQCGKDLGTRRSFDGTSQRNLPCYDWRRPHEAHHQIRHDGVWRRRLSSPLKCLNFILRGFRDSFVVLCFFRLSSTVWAVLELL